MAITRMTTRMGWWKFGPVLNRLEPFKTSGSLYAKSEPEWCFGRLGYEWRESFKRADYAVFSYSTPIAWHDRETGRWTFPEKKYSVTTSRHQNKILVALSELTGDDMDH